jgi:GDSL-like Lipase/Acylhydrolase family
MSKIRSLVRASAAVALSGAALSCSHDADVFRPAPADALFESYVAIGNSITAGYQAGGITDATQRQSYAFLLAQQMRTRYAYASLAAPGCPPPIIDWRTEARPAGAPPCAFRNTALLTDILNNTAVPDAGTTEANSLLSSGHNTLTNLILGGKTQVQRALEARPTFATVWIGNMDALPAASVGQLGGSTLVGPARALTPLANFQANYDAMIDGLVGGAPDLRGVLVGVAQVAGAPRFFPASEFVNNATFRAQWEAVVGGPITIHPSCLSAPGSSSLVSFPIFRAMQAGIRTLACTPTGIQTPVGELGDVFILDPAEQTTLGTRIAAYNAHIQQKAASIGFAYYDPNPTLAAQRTPGGCSAVIPNPAAAANASPFGSCFSNDGVHPSAAGHRLVANALIGVINAEYDTSLPLVP